MYRPEKRAEGRGMRISAAAQTASAHRQPLPYPHMAPIASARICDTSSADSPYLTYAFLIPLAYLTPDVSHLRLIIGAAIAVIVIIVVVSVVKATKH
ncbi:hypothetical protein B0H19DRAFT_1263968 [Mycena capillaripes]|nr:hypothetical protein B0H19DRAFT_1263968 [Mycena capillaripes]